ncbi:MAG: PD40 domain-containing protein [Microthrixaceae bacterium]|nr:PD40 domain-containing protein [Microthrixaceae bacterium]
MAVLVGAVLLSTATACRPESRGARCRGGGWAQGPTHVLRCTKGRWTQVMSKQSVLQALAEASARRRVTATATATTTTATTRPVAAPPALFPAEDPLGPPPPTALVSLGLGGVPSGGSTAPSIASDGNSVAFTTTSALVTTDRNGAADVYVHDLDTGTTLLASATADGDAGTGASTGGSLSTNGRLVAFSSTADDLALGDGNGAADVFVRDLATSTTTRISTTEFGEDAPSASGGALIADDGSAVTFWSTASLLPQDTNDTTDAYLHDLVSGTTELVSIGEDGVTIGDGPSFPAAISADAQLVAIGTRATNLVSGDTNGAADVVVRDRETDQTLRVSLADTGAEPNNDSGVPPSTSGANGSPVVSADLSDDGRFVVFSSVATNLSGDDTNGASDVYVRDLDRGVTTRVSATAGGAPPRWADSPTISGDGSTVAYRSSQRDPMSWSPGTSAVVAVPTTAETSELVSILPDGANATTAASPSLSYDGTRVALTMRNPGNEVYIRTLG